MSHMVNAESLFDAEWEILDMKGVPNPFNGFPHTLGIDHFTVKLKHLKTGLIIEKRLDSGKVK